MDIPERLESREHTETMRVRSAAVKVKTLYPGPIGELLSREVMTWEELSYRFAKDSLADRVIAEIEREWKERQNGAAA